MDDFVSKIVTDAKNPPHTLLLKGYVGASSEEGHIRLYLDSELSDYVEIPEAAILHSQEMPKDKSSIGGSYVWIQRNAKVIHGPVVNDRPKASFLEGRIMATTQSCPAELAGPLALTISGPGCNTIIDGCTDAGPKCPTNTIKTCGDPCTSVGPACPTKTTSCTQSGPSCPTKPGNPSCTQSGPACPTKTGNATCVDPACTSNGPNCPTTPLATCSGPNCPTTPGGNLLRADLLHLPGDHLRRAEMPDSKSKRHLRADRMHANRAELPDLAWPGGLYVQRNPLPNRGGPRNLSCANLHEQRPSLPDQKRPCLPLPNRSRQDVRSTLSPAVVVPAH